MCALSSPSGDALIIYSNHFLRPGEEQQRYDARGESADLRSGHVFKLNYISEARRRPSNQLHHLFKFSRENKAPFVLQLVFIF